MAAPPGRYRPSFDFGLRPIYGAEDAGAAAAVAAIADDEATVEDAAPASSAP